ncbi:MAG: Rid family hydrolase [Fimbriimonadaceae bacterium]|nr:Rid family hydrolase [Fimbriimonadaceae bacterium]
MSGTTATDTEGKVACVGDPFGQAQHAFAKIAKALEELGAGMQDVVRTRMYVTDVNDWEAVGRAHKEAFGETGPCATLVQVAALIDPAILVEIEAEAVVAS